MKISGEKLKFERVVRRMTQEELGERLGGIQKTNISLWENGAKDVPLKYYKELEELFGRGIFGEEFSSKKDGVRFQKKEDVVAVPTLTVAQAMEVLPKTHPFGNKFQTFVDETVPSFFPTAKPGDFAVIVSGSSMEPWYPSGTRLLVGRDEIPKTGQRVIAMIADQTEPVFKIFVDLDEEKFALLSINRIEGHEPMYFNKMSRDEWFWVWPIKASTRIEDDLDAAMSKHGIHHFWERWREDQKKRTGSAGESKT